MLTGIVNKCNDSDMLRDADEKYYFMRQVYFNHFRMQFSINSNHQECVTCETEHREFITLVPNWDYLFMCYEEIFFNRS